MIPSYFVLPPKIDPSEFLPAAEATKCADMRLQSTPAGWVDEITNMALRYNPFLPADRLTLSFVHQDAQMGAALGYIQVLGVDRVTIPVIVNDSWLAPLDLMVVGQRDQSDEATQQAGVGDKTDDRVLLLTQDNWNRYAAPRAGGDALRTVSEQPATAWTESGNALRLPSYSRTVTASAMGASEAAREKLASLVLADKSILAGFQTNETLGVLESWLGANEPKKTAAATPRLLAEIPVAVPEEQDITKVSTGTFWTEAGEAKVGAAFNAVDLITGKDAVLVLLEDGSRSINPPTKVAMSPLDSEEAAGPRILKSFLSTGLKVGTEISLELADGRITRPLRLHKLASDAGAIHMWLTNGLQVVPLVLHSGVKAASRQEDGAWLFPMASSALVYPDVPAAKLADQSKIAGLMLELLPNVVTVAGDQWSLRDGQFNLIQVSEVKVAAVLHASYENGDQLIDALKAGAEANDGRAELRFAVNPESAVKAAAVSNLGGMRAKTCAALVELINHTLPLDKAVKLASALARPDSVDSVLATGLLNEDNVGEYLELSQRFQGVVDDLARTLLQSRLGLPVDGNAVAVAAKALQRVVNDLESLEAPEV
jgi:hypothetical protein